MRNIEDLDSRKEQIASLYKKVLQREPDEPGMKGYLYSDLSLDEIEQGMLESNEYLELQRKANFKSQIESLGSAELLIMGSTPRNSEHVESLKKIGVHSILDLNALYEREYDHSWCSNFKKVPLNSDKVITIEQITEILDFLYTNIIVEGRKTFIHSNNGQSRSPMVVSLFLVFEKQLEFKQAVSIITAKQKTTNPSRNLISGELLTFVKSFKPKDLKQRRASIPQVLSSTGEPGTVEFIPLTKSIFIGRQITSEIATKLRAMKVETLFDLNTKRQKLPLEAQWFSHVHLPLMDDQINEMIPIIIKNLIKYSSQGAVYVVCDEIPKLMMLADSYASTNTDMRLSGAMAQVRTKIVSL